MKLCIKDEHFNFWKISLINLRLALLIEPFLPIRLVLTI